MTSPGVRPLRYTCIFPEAENVHLVKDVAMMARVLARDWQVDSRLVCFDRGQEFPYLQGNEGGNFRIAKIPDVPRYGLGNRLTGSVREFIHREARSIDVLQLFHFTRESVQTALAYKRANPAGKIYLKLDVSPDNFRLDQASMGGTWNVFNHAFLRFVPSLLTAETELARAVFVERYPLVRKKVKLLPNGFDDSWIRRAGLLDGLSDAKEDLVITVGRIGAEPKRSEMLLEALAKMELGCWKVAFVGPVEDSFRPRIASFFDSRPDLKDRVVFTGNIQDRKELYDWYRRAKVFCLTSKWESFCLAMVDALCFGCWIVTTPVSSAKDLTALGTVGRTVESSFELADELARIVSGGFDPMSKFDEVRCHSMRFEWSRLCADVAGWLNEASGEDLFRSRASSF